MISASIVLYKNDIISVKKTILSVLINSDLSELYLIDNSPQDLLISLRDLDSRITYIFNNKNLGFGAGHNVAIKKSLQKEFKYHFVINPDIIIEDKNVLTSMINYMSADSQIGMLMPEILYNDYTIQYLPKLIPTPINIILRVIKWPKFIYSKMINKYELRFVPRNIIYSTPILSGCFTLLNLKIINEVGYYDEKYFMYFEDWDLSRRVNLIYKTIYYPNVSVLHGYKSEARTKLKLFLIYLFSFFYFFNKWGWFRNSNEKKINRSTLAQFK